MTILISDFIEGVLLLCSTGAFAYVTGLCAVLGTFKLVYWLMGVRV